MASQKIRTLTLILTITMLLISACGGAEPSATPTEISLEAIYTAAAATVFAGQTGTAGAQPSPTTTPTLTITPTATITETPGATRAVVVPVQPVIVVVKTLTGTPGTALPSITPTFGAVGGKNSALVQDGAVSGVKAGETFSKTWLIKNTGTVAWNSNYKFTFIGGSLMGSDTTKTRTSVGVGGTYTQKLNFIAPASPGTYTGYWRLADDSGILFGSSFSVVVTIAGATYTPTSAVTATNTPTPAMTATNTPVTPTNTPVTAPSNTPMTAPSNTPVTAPSNTPETAPSNTPEPSPTETPVPTETSTTTG